MDFVFLLHIDRTYIGAVLRRIIFWKISKIRILANFGKVAILGTCHIKNDYSYIVMFWGLRICKENVAKRLCEKDVVRKTLWERRYEKGVVRKTLWERRCEKDNPLMDFCRCSNFISCVFFFQFSTVVKVAEDLISSLIYLFH